MPIYEYKCDSCGNQYEQIRRMSEADSGLACPQCNSEAIRRQLSSFATSSGSGSALPMMGCGKPSCCAITGNGCSN